MSTNAFVDEVAARDAITAERNRVEIRRNILWEAGDTQSLLGTTADAAQILLYEVARLAAALSTAESLAQVRDAAKPLQELLSQTVMRVEAGETRLPYQEKGVSASLQDIEHRATCVADVLKQSKEQNNG